MKLIRQHNIINGVLLMAAVSVSSCDSILEDDSLPVSNENIEISFTRSSENTVSLNDNGTGEQRALCNRGLRSFQLFCAFSCGKARVVVS